MSDDNRLQATGGTAAGIAGLTILVAIAALAATALLVYLLDPDRGNARRSQLLDQIGGTVRRSSRRGRAWTDDLTQQIEAVPHEFDYRASDEPVPDDVIVERVRSELGHEVKHAGGIEVRATNGVVMLSGPVLADEMPGVLATVSTIPGVQDVDVRLQVHDSPDSIPSLQG